MNYAYDVAVSGLYAYVAAGGAGLLVVEISNPGHPIEAGSYDTPGYARGVAATGELIWWQMNAAVWNNQCRRPASPVLSE